MSVGVSPVMRGKAHFALHDLRYISPPLSISSVHMPSLQRSLRANGGDRHFTSSLRPSLALQTI